MSEARLFTIKQCNVYDNQTTEYNVLKKLHIPEYWRTTKGEGIVVAVLDTGVDLNHQDLKGNILEACSFVPGDNQPTDNNGHGTHVAGIIAGKRFGVAPETRLIVGKVLDDSGKGGTQAIVNAIQWVVNWRGPAGEKVSAINMSLGCPQDDPLLKKAVQFATTNGILVICAAGNEGDGRDETVELSFPAAYPEALSVGAVSADFRFSFFSNTNYEVDIAAPGENILSCYPGGRYAFMTGTSMAAPIVTGFAALLASRMKKNLNRLPSRDELYAAVRLHAVDIGKPGIDWRTGSGVLCALPYLGDYLGEV